MKNKQVSKRSRFVCSSCFFRLKVYNLNLHTALPCSCLFNFVLFVAVINVALSFVAVTNRILSYIIVSKLYLFAHSLFLNRLLVDVFVGNALFHTLHHYLRSSLLFG